MVDTTNLPGLTDLQIDIVKTNWNVVKHEGCEILFQFLLRYPENQAIFQSLNGKKSDSFRGGTNYVAVGNFEKKILFFRFARI